MMEQSSKHARTFKASDQIPTMTPNFKPLPRLACLSTPAFWYNGDGTELCQRIGVIGIALSVALCSGCQRSTPANANVPATTVTSSTTIDANVTDQEAATNVDTAVDTENAGGGPATSRPTASIPTASIPVAQQQETTPVTSIGDTSPADREEKTATTSQRQDSVRPDTSATPASMKVRPRTTTRADGVLDLTFDDFEFKIEKDAKFDRSMLAVKIEEFDGQEILIRGFILDSSVFQLKNIKQFVLVRDNQQCCFGPGAYLFHNMQVEMVPGETANFSIRPVTVQGKFHIKPWIGPDGKCYSVYHITAKSVK
jgi:hypothetical protein